MKSITEVRRRVKATWRDAQSFAEWLDPLEAKKLKPAINYSEGYVLKDDDDTLILYMTYNDTDIGDTCVIPKENIVNICELKNSKKSVSKA
tara:strand:+ start:647 stop:919 length:273 start_codon:yes stop_codon:yes gene_type:complete